jgi:microsomal dipeptidase-like Zn-dependent dipeptidase
MMPALPKLMDSRRRITPRRLLLAACLGLAAGLLLFFLAAVPVSETYLNGVAGARPRQVSGRALALHRSLFVADMHADTLLWGRDLLARGSRGHVDLPRLREGNAALQIFTVVTKVPRGLSVERNSADSDVVGWIALANRWPRRTWGSLRERALFQAAQLHAAARDSNGQLVLIRTAADLAGFVERRKREPQIVAAVLGVEGAHALEGDLANLDALHGAGFRMIAPTHFFDTEIGGSASGLEKYGLTELGREFVRRVEARGMIVDLAHASGRTIDDVCSMATRPVVVSHTGVRGTCDNNRNLDDGRVRKIAATGGVVGIGFWPTATCGRDARSIARAIRYTASLVGARHVALGSDFDGAVSAPFDAAGLAAVTDALIEEGFSDEEIEMIMGGNVLRVLLETLPR